MVNFDLKLVGVSAVALLGLYSMNRSQYTDPFTPYDDDQTKRPKRPTRRPKNPLRPRRPLDAEGKVKTLSGKPHTPRKLIKDTDITPKEIAKRLKIEAESFTPPQSAVNNAKKGLELRKEYGRGGLSPAEAKSQGIDSGVTRAKKIASGEVSRHDVRRMSAFNRHRSNNNPSKKMPDGGPTAGTIAWNLWGGTSGVNWAKKKSAAMDAESDEGVDWEGKPYTGLITPDDPDLNEQKADRNKDGKLSSWERAVGNQVAKGIREGGYGSESFDANSDTQMCSCIVPKPRHAGIHPTVCQSCMLIIEAESFGADSGDDDDDDLDDEFPTDWSIDKIHHELFVERNCGLCDRPYEYSRLSRALVTHYLRESNGKSLTWKSKSNPDGLKRTARNIAGFEIMNHGLDALEHYLLQEAKETVVSTQVILLLRKALVPSIIIGDVTEFIKLLELDDVESSDPKFKDDFWEDWESEDYMNITSEFNSEQHDDHDDLDALIKRLDDLNQFAITFMHDGGYGGELISTNLDSGIETQLIGFVEDSIRLKNIRDVKNDEILGIRMNYTDSPKGPVIYLPPADYIASKPQEIEHEHDHDDHENHHHEEDEEDEEDDFIQKLNENSRR